MPAARRPGLHNRAVVVILGCGHSRQTLCEGAIALPDTLHLNVPGISCAGCVTAVKAALSELPGVTTVHVDIESKTVTVTHTAQSSYADMVHALNEAGYPPVAAPLHTN